jgi:predicted HD phosphohydrolase
MEATPLGPILSVDDLMVVLRSLDGIPDDDDLVPALAHLLQTAEVLAGSYPKDAELIAAGLVHDIAGAEPGDHAANGALLVTPVLGERVARLVGGHVDAKRYLVSTDALYGDVLSPDSTRTLRLQGGPMTRAEARAFGESPDFAAMVALRRADDAAKVPGREVRPLGAWRVLLDKVCAQAAVRAGSGNGAKRDLEVGPYT